MADETKHKKFQRLMPPRLEKAVYHIGLLSNLASSNYEFSIEEAHRIRSTLLGAVDEVLSSYGVAPDPAPEPVEVPLPPAPVQSETPEDVLLPPTLYDVKWALDMLKRGDTKDAITLLKRALAGKPRVAEEETT